MPNTLVYTATFGKRDRLIEANRQPGVDYVCFTDDINLRSETWTIEYIHQPQHPRLAARQYKILPHRFFPNYDYSIWHDATLALKADVQQMLGFLGKNKIAVFKHARRTNVFQEAREILIIGRDLPSNVLPQMKRYRQQGFAVNQLVASGVLVRKHNDPQIKEFMELWWQELIQNSVRDQLSFNYCAWKKNVNYSIIPGDILESPLIATFPRADAVARSQVPKKGIRYPGWLKGSGALRNMRNYLISKIKWGL